MSQIRGWSFPVDVDRVTGRIKTVSDQENIKQAVKIVLKTEKAERKGVPQFGTTLNQFMFQEIDVTLLTLMSSAISGSIHDWVEHIEDLEVSVNPSVEYKSSVIVTIRYKTDLNPVPELIVQELNVDDMRL